MCPSATPTPELMAVYVDAPIWERGGQLWCHLTADTSEELHAFASVLGLSRSRFQSKPGRSWVDHYDINEPKRRQAVASCPPERTAGHRRTTGPWPNQSSASSARV